MDKPRKLQIARMITTNVVGYCAGAVVTTVIHNLCPAESPADKAKLTIGAMTVGAMVGNRTAHYAGEQFDGIVETLENAEQSKTTPRYYPR